MKQITWEDVEKKFDEFYTLPPMMIPGPQREKAIKDFIKSTLHELQKASLPEEKKEELWANGGWIEGREHNSCRASVKSFWEKFWGKEGE